MQCWARAQTQVNRVREGVEAWDPRAAERLDPEGWRRELMAADGGGDLRRARTLARHALVLARTPAERYDGVVLLGCLAYDARDGEAEARAARLLGRLRPGRWGTRVARWRAARDNGSPRDGGGERRD